MSRSKQLWTAIAVLAVLLPAGVSTGERQDGLFRGFSDRSEVAWVSVDMATAEDGSMAWEAVGESLKWSYENLRTWERYPIGYDDTGKPIYPPGEHHWEPGFGAVWGTNPPHADGVFGPHASTADMIANSLYIIQGVVTAAEEGFFETDPATLLTLRVSRISEHANLSDEDSYGEFEGVPFRSPVVPILYLVYPSARFSIGGHGFGKVDPSFPPLPEIGDEILYFSVTPAATKDRLVFKPEDGGHVILVQKPGSDIDPEQYQSSWVERGRAVPRSIDELAEIVRQRRGFKTIETATGGSGR